MERIVANKGGLGRGNESELRQWMARKTVR